MKKILSAAVSAVLVMCMLFSGCEMFEGSFTEKAEIPASSSGIQPSDEKNENIIKNPIHDIYYDLLDEKEKRAYKNIYKALMRLETNFYVDDTLKGDRPFDLLYYVLYDNPEIFWARGTANFSSSGRMMLEYDFTLEEVTEKLERIEKKAKQIIAGIQPSGDDYSKALAIFDYIAANTKYDKKAAEEKTNGYMSVYSLEGVLLNARGVCEGYAKAYQYLLSMVGISSAVVPGMADGGYHAWLVTELDSAQYYSDVTWADQTESETCDHHINHYYFAMDTAQLAKTHTIEKAFDLFHCTSQADNYYVREKISFASYDYKTILNACRAVEEKYGRKEYIELYFRNEKAYEKACSRLLDEYEAEKLGKKVLGRKCTAYVKDDTRCLRLF